MIKFVESYKDFKVERDGDILVITAVLNLEDNQFYNMNFRVTYEDYREFIEDDEVCDIIANDDSAYITFIRNHVIIREELEFEKLQFAFDDCTEFFNDIVSWWWNNN